MLHVLFQVGGTDYLLPASDVTQMESFDGATRVPGAPAHVAGVVQLRGQVIPVVDVRARFGLPPGERAVEARIIVVERRERRVALLVDRAREVIDLGADAFRDPPEVVADRSAGFVRAIAQDDRRVLMLVDVDKIVGPHSPDSVEMPHGQTP